MNPLLIPLFYSAATGRNIADTLPVVLAASNSIPETARTVMAISQTENYARQQEASVKRTDEEFYQFVEEFIPDISAEQLAKYPRLKAGWERESKRIVGWNFVERRRQQLVEPSKQAAAKKSAVTSS